MDTARDGAGGQRSGRPLRREAALLPTPVEGWRDLIDGVDAIVWEADPETFQFRYVSLGAERILGYPIHDWLDDPEFWVRTIHPDDRSETVSIRRDQVRHGRSSPLEYRALHRDGREVWLRDRARVVRDRSGRVRLLRGASYDVTESRERLDALERAEGRHGLVSDHILDLVSLHSPDGRFLYLSPASRELIGYEPEELVGRRLNGIVHPEDLPQLQLALREVVEGREPPAIVFRAIRKSGELRWCETKGRRVAPLGPGEEVRVVGVTRDISERRVLQEELAKAQRLEALGRLAGGIAHDFNNLLTVIQGHLDFFRHEIELGPELSGDLDEMERAVQRAASLTGQLLTFGRRDLSRPQALELGEAVRGIEGLLRRLLPERISLECRVLREPLPVRLDPAQLQQVLVNLVTNARDAMPGAGLVTIDVDRRDVGESDVERTHGIQCGSYATIRVSDTGEGMDAGTLARIFEPFFTTKGTERGAGLGLAIVYGVARQSGGHVQVESAVGSGTSFQIWLPLAIGSQAEDRSGSIAGVAAGTGRTILLSEDEPSVRNLVTSVLERSGFRVIPTGSMEEALAACSRVAGRIDLLVAHMILPRGTGLELARRLRHDEPGLPVLLLTGHSEREGDPLPQAEDGVHLLSKPFTSDGLISAVRRALEEAPHRA